MALKRFPPKLRSNLLIRFSRETNAFENILVFNYQREGRFLSYSYSSHDQGREHKAYELKMYFEHILRSSSPDLSLNPLEESILFFQPIPFIPIAFFFFSTITRIKTFHLSTWNVQELCLEPKIYLLLNTFLFRFSIHTLWQGKSEYIIIFMIKWSSILKKRYFVFRQT